MPESPVTAPSDSQPPTSRLALASRILASRSRILTVLALVALSGAGAVVAARISFGADGWLWNVDLPKIHYPLAVFYHEALAAGRLPLWEDGLGLGFPLYAEGQVGAFYPLHWVTFRLEPLLALDVTRLVHLTIAGTGAGLIGLRVSGSRHGAMLTALIAVLGGAIVTKLEWWNVVTAYAWMPWVLLPLAGRGAPTRGEVGASGVLWGLQALAGHPNTWVLTGLAALVLLLARPWPASLGRMAAFGVLGVGVGALQLLPTLLLRGLSTRAGGLSANDVFYNTATPFDVIGAGFVNTFIHASAREWEYGTLWFPDGHFPVLEAGIYLGLPVLALAGMAVPAPRARRWLLVAIVAALMAIVPAFRPEFWTDLPLLNSLRAPVRSYMVVSLAIGVLAAVGVSRLGRTRTGIVWGMGAMAVPIAGYILLTAAVYAAPAAFTALMRFSSPDINADGLARALDLARAVLTSPWPFLAELVLGLATAIVLSRPRSNWTVTGVAALAAVPLVLFMPLANPLRDHSEFSYAGTAFVTAVANQDPHRVLTIGRPGWYPGLPNQLAAAGVPDIEMFSSLNLAHVDDALWRLRNADPAGEARRALGVDVVVTFGSACDGYLVDYVEVDDAYVCREQDAVAAPFWLPASAATVSTPDEGPPIAEIQVAQALAGAVPLTLVDRSSSGDRWEIDAPDQGWVLIDRAWWPSWQVMVDGADVPVVDALGAQLVPVPAGRHAIVATLTLREVGAGTLLGIGALALGALWVGWPRLRPGRRNDDALLASVP